MSHLQQAEVTLVETWWSYINSPPANISTVGVTSHRSVRAKRYSTTTTPPTTHLERKTAGNEPQHEDPTTDRQVSQECEHEPVFLANERPATSTITFTGVRRTHAREKEGYHLPLPNRNNLSLKDNHWSKCACRGHHPVELTQPCNNIQANRASTRSAAPESARMEPQSPSTDSIDYVIVAT